MDLIQISNLSTRATNLSKHSIRFTQSICPDCNMILDAEVFERGGQVFMTRIVPLMVSVRNCISDTKHMYKKFSTYWKDGKGAHAPNVIIDKCACPTNCGLCPESLVAFRLG